MTQKDEIERLFRGNYMPMFILANRMLRDEDAARDIVHDVFSSLLEKNLSAVNAPYLLNAVRFACLKYMRSLTVRERFMRLYNLDTEEAEAEEWPDEEAIAKLNVIIEQHLPDKTRKILELKFNRRLKYREIADELSISEVSVYKHLCHAVNILRQYFNSYER